MRPFVRLPGSGKSAVCLCLRANGVPRRGTGCPGRSARAQGRIKSTRREWAGLKPCPFLLRVSFLQSGKTGWRRESAPLTKTAGWHKLFRYAVHHYGQNQKCRFLPQMAVHASIKHLTRSSRFSGWVWGCRILCHTLHTAARGCKLPARLCVLPARISPGNLR